MGPRHRSRPAPPTPLTDPRSVGRALNFGATSTQRHPLSPSSPGTWPISPIERSPRPHHSTRPAGCIGRAGARQPAVTVGRQRGWHRRRGGPPQQGCSEGRWRVSWPSPGDNQTAAPGRTRDHPRGQSPGRRHAWPPGSYQVTPGGPNAPGGAAHRGNGHRQAGQRQY